MSHLREGVSKGGPAPPTRAPRPAATQEHGGGERSRLWRVGETERRIDRYGSLSRFVINLEGTVGCDPAEILVVFVTAPPAVAAGLARALVDGQKAACVNIVPGLRSIYRWKSAIQDEPESLLVMKTSRAGFEALRSAILAIHPYDVPEIIGLPVGEAHAPYRAWVLDSVGAEKGEAPA